MSVKACRYIILIKILDGSVGMLTMDSPRATAVWQVFPLWMFIAQHALSVNSFSPWIPNHSSNVHIYSLGPTIVDHAKLKALFVPSLVAPDISSKTPAGVLDFMQWDFIFAALRSWHLFG